MQLKRQVEGGAVMGHQPSAVEEVMFDESGITSRDWNTYPILKMADTSRKSKSCCSTIRKSVVTAEVRKQPTRLLLPSDCRGSS